MDIALWSFVVTVLLMTASGAMSIVEKRKTTGDYLVASRNVKPWLAALSTVATNSSGFMFIGMIGYSYRLGVETVWMMIGWIVGDLVAWFYVYPRFRRVSGRDDLNTLSEFLGANEDDDTSRRPIVIAAGVLTLVFLGVYAAAQLKAGSTALHALLDWDMATGIVIGAVIVLIYSYAGGIRADIWTDAAQSFAMIISMVLILVYGYREIGGWDALMGNLRGQDPGLVSLFPEDLAFGAPLFVAGFVFGGFGACGQPHVMTRVMSIESPKAVGAARFYYFLWFIPFFIASVGVGLYSRAVMPGLPEREVTEGMAEPTELALPLITMELLHPVFVGFALAGLFAATVSTADSQIIVCSGSMTNELSRRWRESYVATKLATLTVTAIAIGIALFAPKGVFVLVLVAWSALAATIGTVLVVRLLGWPLSNTTALAMMGVGLATVIAWMVAGLDDDVFEVLPGMAAAFATYGIAHGGELLRAKARARRS